MTRTLRGGRPAEVAPRSLARWAFAAVGIVWLVIVAHGCHGADADHEPAVATPLDEQAPP